MPGMRDEAPPSLVGAAEAARIIGVNRNTISKLALNGELPTSVELPGRTGARLFRLEDVEAYRDRRRAS